MPSPTDRPAAPGSSRGPVANGLLVGIATFALFMAIELVIYGKGIGRALWISALAGLVLFVAAVVFLRAVARNERR